MKENPIRSAPGIPVLLALIAALLLGAYLSVNGVRTGMPLSIVAGVLVDALGTAAWSACTWSSPTRPRC
jgi:hypothetical protein